MQLDVDEEPTDDTILLFKNLGDIINIFQHCPSTMPLDNNKSTNFINSLERVPLMKNEKEYGRVDLLLQHVNNRIFQKYKGFTEAFRRFDKNFDGSLNFREFVTGLVEMGVDLNLSDYRLIFDKIDYNEEEEIDYFKFCLLDTGKEVIRNKLYEDYKNEGNQSAPQVQQSTEEVNPRFKDGRLPKNKDQT